MESAAAPEVPAQSSPTDNLPMTGALEVLGRFGSLVRAAHAKGSPEEQAALEGAFPQGLAIL